MEDIHLRLQVDLVWLTWIAFFIALPFYHFIRQRDPLIRWHEHGNVLTKPYGIWDLCGVVVFFMGMTALASLGGEESAELTTNVLLTGSLMNIAIVCFFAMMWVWRKVDFVELFGLARLNLAGVAIWGGVVGCISILLVMAVGLVSSSMLTPMLGELPPQPVVSAFLDSPDLAFRLIMLVTVVVVAPVFEEVMFRGYLYGVSKKFTDRFFAVVFSSSVFALVHSGAITVVPIFTLALFLTLAYELTGCLLVPITIHMLFNLANVLGMLFFPEAAAGS
jgi:membrane protease YdiL (CAAX protease family)